MQDVSVSFSEHELLVFEYSKGKCAKVSVEHILLLCEWQVIGNDRLWLRIVVNDLV